MRTTTRSMQRLLFAASVLVFVIGIPLYLFPTRTDELFAWTIQPPITAAFLGGGYWASVLLELLAARERSWANARIAIPAVFGFTALTLVVTLVHIDRFHLGSEHAWRTQTVTWVWLLVYASVPPTMAALWLRQMRGSGQDPPKGEALHPWMLVILGLQGAVMLVLGITFLIAPSDTAPHIWPWALSDLTARAIGAWLVGLGIAALHAVLENDSRRVRAGMVGYAAFGVLQLIAVARFAAEEDAAGGHVIRWDHLSSWLYLVFLAGMLAAGAFASLGGRRGHGDIHRRG